MCSALIASVPAQAATNPSGGGAIINPGNDINGNPINPATGSGVSGMQDNKYGSVNNPADAGAASPTDNPSTPDPVENTSVQEAVENCTLVDDVTKAREEAMRIITIVPNVDAIFGEGAAAGCFAQSSKVINLAMEIPSLPSWSNLGGLVKANIQRILLKKGEELIAKGCAVADQALLESMKPMQDYLDEFNSRTDQMNGLIGNFESGAAGGSGYYDKASDFINNQISGTQARIDADSQQMKDINKAIEDKYGNVVNTGTFNPTQNNQPRGEPVAPFFGDSPPATNTFTAPNNNSSNVRSNNNPQTQAPSTNANNGTFNSSQQANSAPKAKPNPYGSSNSNNSSNPF